VAFSRNLNKNAVKISLLYRLSENLFLMLTADCLFRLITTHEEEEEEEEAHFVSIALHYYLLIQCIFKCFFLFLHY